MDTKQGKILLWAIVILILGGTVFALAILPKKADRPAATGELQAISSNDWITANPESKVGLIEYGDFQCPACAAYETILQKLLKDNAKELKFVYRNFPLQQHANAKIAAYAAGAAGQQGKFWEMHDLIFAGQNSWEGKNNEGAKDIFVGYAKILNLNMDQFNQDLNSAEVRGKVEADYQSGLKAGVNSTPTFFLNEKKVQPQSYEAFANLIKQANSPPPAGGSTPNATP